MNVNKEETKRKAIFPVQTSVKEELHKRIQKLRERGVKITVILEAGCDVIEKKKGK